MKKTAIGLLVFGFVIAGMFTLPAKASAVSFTLTQAQLLNFWEIDDDPANCCSFGTPTASGGGAEYSWLMSGAGTAELRAGLDILEGNGPEDTNIAENTLAVTDLSAYDTFDFFITNTNDDIWQFRLFVVSGNDDPLMDADFDLGAANETVSSYVSLAPGESAQLTLSLAGLTDDKDVEALGLDIKTVFNDAENGCDGGSCAGEGFAAVPEPTTMLLLGTGLLGLVGAGYRRRRLS